MKLIFKSLGLTVVRNAGIMRTHKKPVLCWVLGQLVPASLVRTKLPVVSPALITLTH